MKQLSVLMTLALVACSGSVQSNRQNKVVVKSTIAQSSNYSSKDFVGLSTPDEAVNLAFKVSGQILSILVSKGMVVSQGQVLAELDTRDFDLQLAADRASYEQSKSRMERTQRLLAHEAVSKAEAEVAESEYIRIKSMYENSKDVLAESKLRSPFKALVERVYVDTYQRVLAGETIIRVVSPTSTTVEFTIPETSLFAFLDSTTLFKVSFDAYEGVLFSAIIKEYARTTSDASGYPAALTITDVDGYTIHSGMSCTITMLTTNANNNRTLLPLSAIYAPVQGGNFVWLIDSDNRVKMQSVELEGLQGRDNIIVSGVMPGSRVVTAGVYQLQNGEEVKIIEGL